MAGLARRAAERALEGLVERSLSTIMSLVALAGTSEWVARELARRGVLDPSEEDILDVLEEHADTLDLDSALRRAGPQVTALIEGSLLAARRLARREWVERLTYEEALRKARERRMERLEAMLVRWPRLSRRVIDWLRGRLLEGRAKPG